MINNPIELERNSHIVLWDGYNSYLELTDKLHYIKKRTDLIYLYVGSFVELKVAFPLGAMPLFLDPNLIQFEKVKAPLIFRAFSSIRTRIRPYKNWISNTEGHEQLSNQISIVFCGLVRPSPHVLNNFLRGTQSEFLAPVLEKLCNLEWQQNYDSIKKVIIEILEKSSILKSQNPADLACLYSIFNICHRLLIVSYLSTKKCNLFINEYGHNNHVDPYDAFTYKQHLYLDFGSSRGSAICYPRTVDMLNTNKKFINLRFLNENESMLEFLEKITTEVFINQRELEASQIIKTFKAMSEQVR